MKICLLIHNLNGLIGGAEKSIVELAELFVNNGHDVEVVTYDRLPGKPYFSGGQQVTYCNLYLNTGDSLLSLSKSDSGNYGLSDGKITNLRKYLQITIPFLRKFSNRRRKTRLAFLLDDYISANSPDILIAFMPAMAIALGMSKQAKAIPKIFFCHTEPDRDFGLFDDSLRRQIGGLNLLDALRGYDASVVLAKYYVEQIQNKLSHTVAAIPNFITSAWFKTAETFEGKNRENLVVYVGRLEDVKRPLLLLKAWKIFANAQTCNSQWKLEIYGDGTLKNEMQHYILENDISGTCALMGTRRNLLSVYRRAKLAIFPSQVEGVSMAMLEAMSSGVPGVGIQDCTGTREILQNCGFLAQEASADSLAQAIQDALNNEELLELHSYNSKMFSRKFSEEAVYNKWERLFEYILGKKSEKIACSHNCPRDE